MAPLSKEPAGLRGGQRAAVALALTMLMAGSLAAKQHSRAWKKGTLVDTETVTISGAPVAVAQSGSGGGSYAGAAAQQAQAAATMAASLPHTYRHYTIWETAMFTSSVPQLRATCRM